VLEKSNYKLYYDGSKITDRTIHNNRLDVVVIKVTIKEAHLADVAIPNANKPRSTIKDRLQKYRLERRAYKNTTTERGLYCTISTILNGHYSKQITRQLKTA